MRVVAVLAVRNERPYLANHLTHLIANGLDYLIIDNESDDGSAELLSEPSFARHLAGYRRHPFSGAFDWSGLIVAAEAAIAEIDADWVILLAPDEWPHPYAPQETLHDAIARIGAAGHDVIDFNEFVFLPIEHDYVADRPGPQPLHWYYFFEPKSRRLLRARRTSLEVSWVKGGGHSLDGDKFNLAPETFALRHYIVRSQEHAFGKYAERRFRQDELDRGWHRQRVGRNRDRFTFPPTAELDFLENPESRDLSRARPRTEHYWDW